MTRDDIRSVLEQVEDEARRKLRAKLLKAPDDAARLSLVVDRAALRRTLPRAALEGSSRNEGNSTIRWSLRDLCSPCRACRRYIISAPCLRRRGSTPLSSGPGLGRQRAGSWSLGFAPELAGFAGQNRPANFVVEGPTDLGELHDYQKVCVDNIRALVRGGRTRRGLVSLPTGAGKTRVAVQALVEEIRDGDLEGPIVWIAQSDELCEQAVETWSYIWRAIGPRPHSPSVGSGATTRCPRSRRPFSSSLPPHRS